MLRRHIITSIVLTLLTAVFLGLAYPLLVAGFGRVVFPWRTNGSFITRDGKVVGSALLGQEFLDPKGNPDPAYVQPRPSNAGNGYDPTASGASNLGPGDPRLIGFVPGLNTVGLDGKTSATNPFATPDDPNCVPTDTDGKAVASPTSDTKYAKNADGTYVCFASTVPERASAYRQLNNLATSTTLPVDAVTSSASGLDPNISLANAQLQAARVADDRHLPLATVENLIKQNTQGRQWGFLGEQTVNVLDLNLALDALKK